MSSDLKVLVAGGSPLVRSSMSTLLSDEVSGETRTTADVTECVAAAAAVDVVVAATLVGRTPLLQIAPELLSAGAAVLAVCNRRSLDRVADLLLAGVSGYLLLEDMTSAELVQAVRSTAAGGVTLHPEVAALVLQRWRAAREGHRPAITVKERTILTAMGQGRTVREVARELGISERTVETHRTRIYAKLQVNSQAAAVGRAREWGLFEVAETDNPGGAAEPDHPPGVGSFS